MFRDVRLRPPADPAASAGADPGIIRASQRSGAGQPGGHRAGACMTTATSVEREIKLAFESADAARAAVVATGATPLLGRRLQEDALLDTADEQLRQRRCVLRVRIECGKSRLTFKGPVQPGIMKLREELETVVGDGDVVLRVLRELGLSVWFRYEKYRE